MNERIGPRGLCCNSGRLLGIPALALTVAGCASGPRVYTTSSPSTDLSAYRSFAFTQKLGTDRGDGQRTMLSSHLMTAAREQMKALGYR